MCFFLFFFPVYAKKNYYNFSYKILNPKGIDGVADLQKAAKIILESTGLDEETYRIGNTKACPIKIIFFFLLLSVDDHSSIQLFSRLFEPHLPKSTPPPG